MPTNPTDIYRGMKNESFFQRARGQLLNPIAKAVAAAEEVLDRNAEGHGREALLASLINLFVLVLKADGSVSDAELQVVSRALREEHGEAVVKQLQERATADTLPDVKATCAELRGIPVDDREKLLQSLFIAAYADNHYDTEERDCLRRIASELEISDDSFEHLQEAALEQHNARMRVVRSGAGLLAAVVVLALFIVTATFLKAVLFGLMLAYFFLPLQQKLARSFLENGWAAQVYHGVMLCFKPIGWVIGGVQGIFRRGKKKEPEPEPDEATREKVALDQSCNATVLSVMGAIVLAVAGLTVFTLTYQPPELPKTDVLQKKAADYAAKAKDWKVIGPAAQELETLMRDPEALDKMREWLMGGSAEEEEGQVTEGNKLKTLTALASAVGFLGNFLLNALL
ncbi:MAG: TerB family tellurite resistance protein, partial [Verrucomicrobiota bacterium]|nr:TerB family tellurite resistance protein [Verrucomicrobiota bacterium]